MPPWLLFEDYSKSDLPPRQVPDKCSKLLLGAWGWAAEEFLTALVYPALTFEI